MAPSSRPIPASPSSPLAAGLLRVLIALIILRPWDYAPELASVRPVSVMIVAVALAWLLSKPQIRAFSDPPARPLWLLLGLIVATAPLSHWPTRSAEVAFKVVQDLAIFTFIAHLAATPAELFRLTRWIVACCAFHGCFALVKYAAEGMGPPERVYGAGAGSFADPNDLALSLVMVFPLAWWLVQSGATRRGRFLAFAALMAMLGGILITQSRGGLLALGAAVLVLGIRSRNPLAFLTKTLAIGATVLLLMLPTGSLDRYASIPQYQSDESAMTRVAIWKAGLRMVGDHPLTGVGAGTFELVYGKHYIDRQNAGNVWRAAHSSYIQAAAELGIVGLLIWLALPLSGFLTVSRLQHALRGPAAALDEADALDRWADAMAAGLVGFLVGAAFLSRAYDTLLVILLGMAA
ncbi:MAG TPA: O-antigen ligase family protein, partial [Lacipirellulaceae bacterium]|nr:O-antigen ligase family protein [Lacipirellulaceae bacterium]